MSPQEYISVSSTGVQKVTIKCLTPKKGELTKITVFWKYNDPKTGKTVETEEQVIEIKCSADGHQLVAPTINQIKTGGPTVRNIGLNSILMSW